MEHTALRRNPAFRRYWLGRLASYAGDQAARTALLIAVFDRYGGLAVSLLLVASTAPRLLGPVLGTLADRYRQGVVMVGSDTVQAAVYLLLALVRPGLAVTLALVAVATCAATAFTSAGRATVPRIVPAGEIPAANAALALAINTGVATGPALGGLLYGAVGLPAALLANVASFVISAVLIAAGTGRLGSLAGLDGGPRAGAPGGGRPALGSTMRAGLVEVRRHAVVRAVSLTLLLSVAFGALDNVAVVPLGRGVFAASPLLVGLLGSGYGLGMVVSPVLLLGPGRRLAPASVFCLALAAFGLGTGLTGLSPVLALAICGQVLAGAGNGWENVGAETLIQQTVPADRLGTVFGTVYAFPYGAELIAYLAGGPLLEHYGPRVTLVIAGLGVLGTLLLAYPLLASVRRPATVLLPPTPASVDPSS